MAIIGKIDITQQIITSTTNRIDELQKQNEAQQQYIEKLEFRMKQLERTLRGIRRIR